MRAAPGIRFLARGDWPATRLASAWIERGSQRLDATQQAAVEAAWLAAGARPGVYLFDGSLCRLESFHADADGLRLALSATTYKAFMGTNGAHPEWADTHGPHALANPLGTSVALRSSDGHLVFGRRSQAVALYPGCAHPFGGTMEIPAPGTAVDIIAEAARELAEEVGVAGDDLVDLRAIALMEDLRLRQPELVYAARCRRDLATLIARLDRQEHDACWTVPDDPDAIATALTGDGPITPVLRGTLLAWGALRFGDAWFARHHATAAG
jgi:hypothetical protein